MAMNIILEIGNVKVVELIKETTPNTSQVVSRELD
jgi:hypothetical protein